MLKETMEGNPDHIQRKHDESDFDNSHPNQGRNLRFDDFSDKSDFS